MYKISSGPSKYLHLWFDLPMSINLEKDGDVNVADV
jgi:hypothetical protein